MRERLARLRVPLGFAAGAVVWWLARPTPASLAVGGAVALLGEAVRFWAAGHLQKAREVTSSGPYRLTAHPLYVGSSMIGLGLALACRQAMAAVLIDVYLGATLTAAIRSEEAFLCTRFGDQYDRYRRGGAAEVRRGFSWALAVDNREPRALAGVIVSMALLALRALL